MTVLSLSCVAKNIHSEEHGTYTSAGEDSEQMFYIHTYTYTRVILPAVSV